MTEEYQEYTMREDHNPKTKEEAEKHYDINIKLIEEKHSHIFAKIKAFEEGTYKSKTEGVFDCIYLAHNEEGQVLNIVLTKDNENYLVCDHNDSLNQAKEWLNSCIDDNNKIELLYGMGMGYHIDEIFEKYPYKRIMIIEPNIELFIHLLHSRDLSNILTRCWIFLEEDMDVVLKNFLQLYWDAKNKGVFKLQSINIYNIIFNEDWNKFSNKFKDQINALTVDTTTRKVLTETWLSNYTDNIYKIKEASNANGFLGQFKDIPAILVSAGSSLEKNIHLLKDIKDKCLIVSASSARLCMKQYGVSPHMFTTVDASEGEKRIVENIENDNEYMVYSNQIYPKSLEIFDGKKIFINYNSDFYTLNFLAWAKIESGYIMSAPSVSNTVYDFLFKLGCNPIIFIGQDLSFTQNKQYAGEIDYGIKMSDEELKASGYVLTKDIYDNDVYTMPTFLAMKNCFEDQIVYTKKLNPELDVINCTEGGIGIKGARNERLEDIIKDFKDNNVMELLEKLYKNSMFNDFSDKIREFNDILLSELAKVTELIKEQYKKLKEVEKYKIDNKSPENMRKFDELLTEADTFSKTRETMWIYKLMLSPLLQVDLFKMGVEFIQQNEKETNFKKKRKSYLTTLRNQLALIEEKIKYVEDLLK